MNCRIFSLLLLINNLLCVVYCANILCVFPFPSVSHQAFFRQIWKALSLKGHQVVVITPHPLNEPKLKNLLELDVSSGYQILRSQPLQNVLDKKMTIERFNYAVNLSFSIVEHQFNEAHVVEFLRDESRKFDVVIIEDFLPMLYALGSKYNAPVIGMLSLPLMNMNCWFIGNPIHPVLYPDILMGFKRHMSFLERIESTLHTVKMTYNYIYTVLPKAQPVARRLFGENVPDLYELQKNISLVISNSNHLIYPVRPAVSASIEVSFIHIEPPKDLPQDLKKCLDESPKGLIYFSLGSTVKSVNIPDKLKQVIISALSELPYKVLWKWEADHMPGKPDNVIIRKWLPQQDVLAHPNVKAFVTQGGLQSIEEAIARGVPMVGIPFLGDQLMNVLKLTEAEIAIHLDKDTVTKDQMKNAIIEVVENEKYRKRILEIRDLLYDQPMKSIDKAVWWIEYVIRHKGARHLRSPALDLPLYQYFLLDVIGATLTVIVLVLYLTYKSLCFIFRFVSNTKKIKMS